MKSTDLGDEGMRKRLSPKDIIKLRLGPISIYPGKEEAGKGRETSLWVQGSEVREHTRGWRKVL